MGVANSKITQRQIAEFRFSILGSLFAKPPEKGELASRLRELAQTAWHPPGCSYPETYSIRTLERWYSAAKKSPQDPVTALLPIKRCDAGVRRVLTEAQTSWLRKNYHTYRRWTWKLHADNLAATELQPVPSYATILRWMRSQGLFPARKNGVQRKNREIRSYECDFPGELWHFDGHQASRKILDADGTYKEVKCIAFLDDYSRLCCHCQWVYGESAEEIVHAFIQAILKRGLPRKVQSDNGSGMIAEEFEEGVKNLAIIHEKTLPRSPYQNGKIESFWKPMESRLLAMLEHVKPLTLSALNQATQAWVEQEYNVSIHSETKEKPIERFYERKNVLRNPPSYENLKRVFRMKVARRLRRTDNTLTIDGVRFEIPLQFRHMETLILSYSRWNMRTATIIDPETHREICDIFPINKSLNANGNRRSIDEVAESLIDDGTFSNENLPPLLQRYLREHKQESLTSGYIPIELNLKKDVQ